MRRFLPLLLLCCACAGDSGVDTPLARYDFFRLPADPLYGARLGEDVGLHVFDEGWATPKGAGLLANGPAAATLQSMGSRGVLRLRSRGPANLLWDDRPLARLTNANWDSTRVEIPPQLFSAGGHRLRIEPDGQFTLATLELRARLDADESRRWTRQLDRPPVDPRWQLVPAPATSEAAELPDILMLVLDTLRADHVGAYGYERATTPNIDELAREGLRFSRVHADASYTLCSVSSYFTGRSWQEHRVLEREDALPQGMPTLATILAAAGYQTRAISDNPNVSIARHHDRGFDEFREAWHRVPTTEWNPEIVESEFEDSLSEAPGEAPTFYYVHMMPPHSPYFPGEEHDLFGDPGYDGRVRGTVADVGEFDRDDHAFGEADRARLVSLYDGGIHRGDAMLGRIRARWSALGRSRPLLTIVLSDHGEAFGEHGRFGHSTSVHDEMTHVPLIMHPRELVQPLVAGVDRFHGLPDLMPMLLALLRVPLPDVPWPRGFLRVLHDPTIERDALVVRATPYLFGLRKPGSLLELRLWGTQGFYDLEADPGARGNLRIEAADRYVADLRELRAFLEHPIGDAEAQDAQLTDEERERLRALGYF